jgi:uncharacterized membrane protein
MSSVAPGPQSANDGKPSFWRELRDTFVAGVVVMLPLAVTFWLVKHIWSTLDSPFSSLLKTVSTWLGSDNEAGQLLLTLSKWPGLGILVSLSVVLLAGFLARNLLGKHYIHWVDEMAGRIPLVRAIYTSVKQVSDTVFTSAGKQAFRQAVLVRFPTAESLAIGFVTGESPAAGRGQALGKVVNVFVPTAPNPTSGFLLMIPEDKLVPLGMSVEDAFKMVVSGGVVKPPAASAADAAGPEAPAVHLQD